jgi:hypothetical protein
LRASVIETLKAASGGGRMTMTRDCNSFWAVWWDGKEWPSLFGCPKMARDAARREAKTSSGKRVHLMRIESVGTIEYPDTAVLSGQMALGDQ